MSVLERFWWWGGDVLAGKWVKNFLQSTCEEGITLGSSLTWSDHESHLLFHSGQSLPLCWAGSFYLPYSLSRYVVPFLLLQFMATVMLLLGILIIHDEKNNGALKGTQALLTGILVLGIGLGMGMNTGYAINPSRDLPPRVFTAIAGWGMDVFTWVTHFAFTLLSLQERR